MKRSPALVPLGHDHHRALEAALRLRRATDESVSEDLAYFREFWADHVHRRHFEIEEELVLPAITGDQAWDEMAERVRRDHRQIRAWADSADSVGDAHTLGALLNDHVRFEERELFEFMEARLDPGELDRLGRKVEAARPEALGSGHE